MESTAVPLLRVRDLAVSFTTTGGDVQAVRGVTFDIPAGATLAIVGESGSGKSTTAMAIIGLLSGNGRVTAGSIQFNGTELVGMPESGMRKIRGGSIGLVPQDPMSNLNPVSKIGTQVAETLLVHGKATRRNVTERVIESLTAAGLPDAAARAKQYPHEFSGGMRQRALIAIGLACSPKLLIADEPTSALDVTVQRTILDQIDTMTAELGTSVLLITHDLGLAAERASHLVVMNKGEVVEAGPAAQLLANPQHDYTKALVAAAPSVAAARAQPGASRPVVPLVVRTRALQDAPVAAAAPAQANIIEVRNLTKVYPVRGKREPFVAVDDVSFDIPRGRTVAVVGESGSGKTTTARMMLRVVDPTSGSINFNGQDVARLDKRQLRDFRQRVQPIFQDPYSSLNPSFTIGRVVEEPLKAYKRGSETERRARVRELMDQVSLSPTLLRRYPGELSGGQRQRVAIARALALSPDLIVCDEPVSALDVLVQAQILTLLGDLQEQLGLSYLFISHDLAVVRQISDLVCVMKDGAIVETAPSEQLFSNPQHPYTRRLLASIPGNELKIA
jgi:peptide/nickel transport system ATP-binding protein